MRNLLKKSLLLFALCLTLCGVSTTVVTAASTDIQNGSDSSDESADPYSFGDDFWTLD